MEEAVALLEEYKKCYSFQLTLASESEAKKNEGLILLDNLNIIYF